MSGYGKNDDGEPDGKSGTTDGRDHWEGEE